MKASNRNNFMYLIAGLLAVAGCISMVFFPTVALESAQKGVALWARAILPALLPFFICANFMISIGVPGLIGRFFEKSFQLIFGAPGSSAFVFIISITSGYPMGPKLIGDMGRRGEITLFDAKRMLTFCSTSGPLFLLGTVGVGMLHSPPAGAVIAVSHYLGAVLNGILFRLIERKKYQSKVTIKKKNSSSIRRTGIADSICVGDNRLLDLFTDAIMSALKTLGIICCYLVIFTMVTDLLELAGVFHSLSEGYQRGFVKGLLEMTVGCNNLALSEGIGISMKCVLAAFLISFGGFSIFAQSMSVLYGLNISPRYYLKVKLAHGLMSGLVAYFGGPYILNMTVKSVGAFGISSCTFDLGILSQLLFSAKMVIIILLIFIFTIVMDYLTGRKDNKPE